MSDVDEIPSTGPVEETWLRIVVPFGGVVMLASGFAAWSAPHVYDPLVPRVVLASMGIGIGLLGFVRSQRHRVHDLAWLWGVLSTAWFQWVGFVHDLTIDDVTGLLIIVALAGGFSRTGWQVGGLVVVLLGGMGLFLTIPEPGMSPALSSSLLLLTGLGLGLMSVSRVRLLGTLEERVHQRTIALQESLERVQKEARERQLAELNAERASRAKSRFLETMSHELRTPLTAVLGYTEMIGEELQELEQPDLLADLHKVEGSASHLLALIDQMLDLTRIESESLRLDQVRFAIAPVVDEAVACLGSTGIDVQVDAGLEAMGDPLRFRQVLVDLLDNARKFSPENAPVRVRASSGAQGIDVSVRDQGIGIAPEDQERIFERFVQLDASSTRTRGGAGLGLAVARELVRAMGGELGLESEPARGSTFTIRLQTAG